MHNPEALLVLLKLFNLLESWSYNILDTKRSIVKHCDHGIDRRTMSLCNFEDLFKCFVTETYVTSSDFPIHNVRRCKNNLIDNSNDQKYLLETFAWVIFKTYLEPVTIVQVET